MFITMYVHVHTHTMYVSLFVTSWEICGNHGHVEYCDYYRQFYLYLEQGESGSTETDYCEQHDNECGCVENADGLGRCEFTDTLLKVES